MSGRAHRLAPLVVASATLLGLVSCGPSDSDRASEIFADCLRRNGVQAEAVEVTLNSDGSVGEIALVIISEGNVAYEPTLRLACTEEVALNR